MPNNAKFGRLLHNGSLDSKRQFSRKPLKDEETGQKFGKNLFLRSISLQISGTKVFKAGQENLNSSIPFSVATDVKHIST